MRCLFSLRTDILRKANDDLFATNYYNSIFNLPKLCGKRSGVVQCIHAERRAIDLGLRFFTKIQDQIKNPDH